MLYIHIIYSFNFAFQYPHMDCWIARKSYTDWACSKVRVIQNVWRFYVRYISLSLLHPMPEVVSAYGDTSWKMLGIDMKQYHSQLWFVWFVITKWPQSKIIAMSKCWTFQANLLSRWGEAKTTKTVTPKAPLGPKWHRSHRGSLSLGGDAHMY